MATEKQAVPIVRTKLHRPLIAGDLVSREALHARLDESGHQPLILVSAPAGYGKSTLVSHWLETRDGPSAWLSLDETDSDIRTFLSYVVAAVQTVFPEACAETLVQLKAAELPPLPMLAGRLSNDLDNLEQSLVLVLDDYHHINEPVIHDLLYQLLQHPPRLSERAIACIFLGGARQMIGDLAGARRVMSELIADPSVPLGTFQARLEMTLCFIDWVAADLPACRTAANRLHTLGETFGLPESFAIAKYFLGIVDYHENDLSAAESTLLSVVSTRRVPNLEWHTESAFALALAYQARGQADKANETLESVCEQVLRTGNTTVLQRARACQADLALRQGRTADALEWARRFQVEPFEANVRFQEPRFILVKILIAEGGTANLDRAAAFLQNMEAFFTKIHGTRLLIEVLALKALVLDAQGEESVAGDSLTKAIHLAQPGGFIRLFVDLGPGLARLLKRLDLDAAGRRYIERILNAFQDDEKTGADKALDHPLTKRELQILKLLSDELSKKQISEKLCISLSTVKRHTENIYHKLDVPDRHKAVAKAIGLAIIHAG